MGNEKDTLPAFLASLQKASATDETMKRAMNLFLDGKARAQGIPIHGKFELTPLCNLSCKMCYIHLTKGQVDKQAQQLLTVDEWKRIIDEAIDAGMLTAMLTGGEVLTYPGFEEVYTYLQERGIRTTVKTNGVLLDEKRMELFRRYPPDAIQISLYGSNNDAYEKVTGSRCFDRVIHAISLVRESGIPLGISITPSRFMVEDAEALLTLTESLDVEYNINSGLFPAREDTGRDVGDMDLTLDEYVKLYHIVARLRKEAVTPACEEDIPAPDGGSASAEKGLRCAGGRSNFAVCWDGTMHPCLNFGAISADVRHAPFQEAWKSVNTAANNYPFPRECIGCRFHTICPVCVLCHEAGAQPGHANRKFCERAHRMVEEGFASHILENRQEEE